MPTIERGETHGEYIKVGSSELDRLHTGGIPKACIGILPEAPKISPRGNSEDSQNLAYVRLICELCSLSICAKITRLRHLARIKRVEGRLCNN